MPHADDPNGVFYNAIEETIGRHDDFAVRQVGKLGEPPSGIRERLQALQRLLSTFAESCRGRSVVASNVRDVRKKLRACARGEPYPHASSSAMSESAATMTSWSSCPTPMAISLSPWTRSSISPGQGRLRRQFRSCLECSSAMGATPRQPSRSGGFSSESGKKQWAISFSGDPLWWSYGRLL